MTKTATLKKLPAIVESVKKEIFPDEFLCNDPYGFCDKLLRNPSLGGGERPDIEGMWQSLWRLRKKWRSIIPRESDPESAKWVESFLCAVESSFRQPVKYSHRSAAPTNAKEREDKARSIVDTANKLAKMLTNAGLDRQLYLSDYLAVARLRCSRPSIDGYDTYEEFCSKRLIVRDKEGNQVVKFSNLIEAFADHAARELKDDPFPTTAGKNAAAIRQHYDQD